MDNRTHAAWTISRYQRLLAERGSFNKVVNRRCKRAFDLMEKIGLCEVRVHHWEKWGSDTAEFKARRYAGKSLGSEVIALSGSDWRVHDRYDTIEDWGQHGEYEWHEIPVSTLLDDAAWSNWLTERQQKLADLEADLKVRAEVKAQKEQDRKERRERSQFLRLQKKYGMTTEVSSDG